MEDSGGVGGERDGDLELVACTRELHAWWFSNAGRGECAVATLVVLNLLLLFFLGLTSSQRAGEESCRGWPDQPVALLEFIWSTRRRSLKGRRYD